MNRSIAPDDAVVSVVRCAVVDCLAKGSFGFFPIFRMYDREPHGVIELVRRTQAEQCLATIGCSKFLAANFPTPQAQIAGAGCELQRLLAFPTIRRVPFPLVDVAQNPGAKNKESGKRDQGEGIDAQERPTLAGLGLLFADCVKGGFATPHVSDDSAHAVHDFFAAAGEYGCACFGGFPGLIQLDGVRKFLDLFVRQPSQLAQRLSLLWVV